jgi:NADH:ubiquinone oxidoreductase subunit 6 (subunit J)
VPNAVVVAVLFAMMLLDPEAIRIERPSPLEVFIVLFIITFPELELIEIPFALNTEPLV